MQKQYCSRCKMVKKTGGKAQVFKKGWLVTLAKCNYVQSQNGCSIALLRSLKTSFITAKCPIHRSHSASELNPIESPKQALALQSWTKNTKNLLLTKAV